MASRKGIHIYIRIYFMAVRNCIFFFFLRVRGTSLLTFSYIGERRNDRKLKCENIPFIVLTLIVRRAFVSDLFIFKPNSNLQPLG